jgi:predicted nuclease of predicted toxin-antitoxin system
VRPEPTPAVRLFIDRDLWSHRLDSALRTAGVPFERHRDHFADDAEDADWLRAVGARGWAVVTRDQNIRRRPNELAAVREARMHVFALTSGNLSATLTAEIVIAAWPSIQVAVRGTQPPKLWSVTRGGVVRPLSR